MFILEEMERTTLSFKPEHLALLRRLALRRAERKGGARVSVSAVVAELVQAEADRQKAKARRKAKDVVA